MKRKILLVQVLDELKDSLDGALPAWKVNKLLTYLKVRVMLNET